VAVHPYPRWIRNPYLLRLTRGLEAHGVDVRWSHLLTSIALTAEPDDWVHLHWPGGKLQSRSRTVYRANLAIFRALLGRLRRNRVRIAWTAHNLFPHDDAHADLAREGRKILVGALDHVFVHFDGAQRTLADELGWRGPVTVTPHGHFADDYPAPPARADARRTLGLPAAGQVALVFGLLRPYKGIGDAVRGFLEVARPDDRLIIAGHPEGDVGAELALAKGDPRVLVHARRIPKDEVPVLFGAADVALLAHRQFFTSGSAVLALSMGVPLVGPAVHHLAALPHVTAITGGGIAEALVRARDVSVDPEELRGWARRELSWETSIARTASVLTS
jgi:beta-1,4-mannosyltransferase